MLNINNFGDYIEKFTSLLIEYSPRVISAFIILIIGLYVIRFVHNIVKSLMSKRNVDPTLSKFLTDILIWALRILLFITFISKLGIETTSFVAILGAAGLAISLSLQGSLSNFAGGMLIILFKPFKVGDSIEAQGVMGTVQEIQIFVTKLVNSNNQTIFIPNGVLSNGIITNYTMLGIRRAELVFAISYETDIKTAKNIVLSVLKSNPNVLQNPEPTVIIKDLTENAINLSIRPWTKHENFVNVSSEILENCKEKFDSAGIITQPYVREAAKI